MQGQTNKQTKKNPKRAARGETRVAKGQQNSGGLGTLYQGHHGCQAEYFQASCRGFSILRKVFVTICKLLDM